MAVAEGEPHDKTFALHGQYNNGGFDEGDGDVFGYQNADGTSRLNINQQSSAASQVILSSLQSIRHCVVLNMTLCCLIFTVSRCRHSEND